MDYNKQYFLDKFNAIPEEEIGMGELLNHCALWHCGVKTKDRNYIGTDESCALIKLFGGQDCEAYEHVYRVNDGSRTHEMDYFSLGKTPKERIIAFLNTR